MRRPPTPRTATRQISSDLEHCIRACQDCHAACLNTVMHCLRRGGSHADAEHIRLLMDCVQVCAAAADLMVRGSPFQDRACALCADVSASCGEECERLNGDETVRHCAEVCLRCAESCRLMAGVAV